MRIAPLVVASIVSLASCAPAQRATVAVAVADVTVTMVTTSGCTPIVLARITSPVDTELIGATVPREVAAGVTLHLVAGGPTLGGHEGHLDGDGRRHTTTPTALKLTNGSPTGLSPDNNYLTLDQPTHQLEAGDVVPLTFRFSSAPDVVASATVTSTDC